MRYYTASMGLLLAAVSYVACADPNFPMAIAWPLITFVGGIALVVMACCSAVWR